MSKTITVTKTIPAPPDGWEYQDRIPQKGEPYVALHPRTENGKWEEEDTGIEEKWYHTMIAYAYRTADPYAERYEALGLPDGWAWMTDGIPQWSQDVNEISKKRSDMRRIINRKAYKPDQIPKETP